jgi:hypothetical protein
MSVPPPFVFQFHAYYRLVDSEVIAIATLRFTVMVCATLQSITSRSQSGGR